MHTLLDAVFAVSGSIFVGFWLALLLQGPARHIRILRTAVFLPAVIAMVAAAELWTTLLYPSPYGSVNSLLGEVGLGPEPFFDSPHSALASVILMQIWKNAPYDMVIFVAGLARIDRQMYEACEIDGAGAWQRLRFVTLPALRPITTIVLALGIIRGLRVFTEIWVSTNGGPAGLHRIRRDLPLPAVQPEQRHRVRRRDRHRAARGHDRADLPDAVVAEAG